VRIAATASNLAAGRAHRLGDTGSRLAIAVCRRGSGREIAGDVARPGRLRRRNCEVWLLCCRTSRCSGRSRRRDIGVTSTNRSCGARAAERQIVRRTWHLAWSSDLERWQLPFEGVLGRPDIGVALWAGRNGKWAVTPDARNTRTAIAVCRGSDSWLESRRTSR